MNVEKNDEELRREIVSIAVANKENKRLWLTFASLIAGAIKGRDPATAAKLSKDFSTQEYLPFAQEVRDFMAEHPGDLTEPDARAMFIGALDFLDSLISPLTPQQKAAATRKAKAEKQKAEYRQQRADREAQKQAARAVLHDPNAAISDKLAASKLLEAAR